MRELLIPVNINSDDSCEGCHLTKSCRWAVKIHDGDFLVGYTRGPECLASEMCAVTLRGIL